MYSNFGIPIAEYELLVTTIIYTVLLLAVLGSMLLLSCSYEKPNPKETARYKKLQAMAKSDVSAQKQLNRMERKLKNRRKHTRGEHVTATVVCTLAICWILTTLFIAVIPGWTDYIVKDYVIYEGNFRVEHPSQRISYTYLADGTKLWGCGGLPEGSENGTVVYSKRTRLVLGAEP